MVRLSHLTPAQKFLLAVSLPVTLVFLYFLFRKNNDEDDEDVEPRTGTSRHAAIEVQVPSDAVGAVIGQQGSQIKAIQESTKTRINFKGDRSADTDRVLVIRGTQEAVHQAELMVRKIIVDQPPIVTDEISVPREAIGRIIGRNGDTIRTLTRMSKAKIIISRTETRNVEETIVTVQLKGSPAAIDLAKSLILEKVAEEQEFRAKNRKSGGDVMNHQKSSVEVPVEPTNECNQLGEEFSPVYVSAVEHPEHFWLQVLSSKSNQLDALVAQMTEYCGNQNLGEPVTELKEGDIVAAPFEHDNQWYRTEVCEIDGDSVDLYYVDFGDSCWLSKDRIKILRNDLKDLPFQAVECCLADVKPLSGSEWSSDTSDVFEKLCHSAKWKPLMAKFVGSRKTIYNTTTPIVQLVDTNGPTDVDIAAELVRQGLAIRSSAGGANSAEPDSAEPDSTAPVPLGDKVA